MNLRRIGAGLVTLALLTGAAPAMAALSGAEQKMAASVDANTERDIKLLESLVNVNSGSMNLPGVEKVGQMLRPEFEALGFKVRWVPMAKAGRAGHLIAEHEGNGRGKRMLLIAHLDTVFEPDSSFQKFVRRGDVAEGPGVADVKGGIVVILAALRAMKEAGTLGDADIAVMLTGDEEKVGNPQSVARADLIAAGKWADVALDFEGLSRQNGRDMGVVARRSSASWTLKTTGRAGHSSGVFSAERGDGAIYEMARILSDFRRELPEPSLTFNVGLLLGGSTAELDARDAGGTATGKSNIIPGVAIARGDIRTLSAEQEARVRAKMQAIVQRHLPLTGAELTFNEGYPPMAPTEGNRALLARLNEVNRDLGLPEMTPLDPSRRGAGDIGFVAKDVDGLVGLGVSGQNEHAEGETVDLKTIPLQAKRAAILMTRLAQTKR